MGRRQKNLNNETCFSHAHLLSLCILSTETVPADAGPGTATTCYAACVGSCVALGVFGFFAALGPAAPAAGIVGPGRGVWVTCSSICGPVCANGLWFPTPLSAGNVNKRR